MIYESTIFLHVLLTFWPNFLAYITPILVLPLTEALTVTMIMVYISQTIGIVLLFTIAKATESQCVTRVICRITCYISVYQCS